MADVSIAEFDHYLWARYATERNAQIARINPDMPDDGSGMTNQEASVYLASLPAEKRSRLEDLAG